LEQQLRELQQAEQQERQRAQQLEQERDQLAGGVQNLRQNIGANERDIKNAEQLVRQQVEERKTAEIHAKDQMKNEAIAKEKAEELARRTAEERRKEQQNVSRLVAEEQELKQKAQQLGNKPVIAMEEKPATVDVYQHTRFETKEQVPVATEHAKEECDEHKSVIGKVVDGVKNLF
jgi:chromosome segregation ATPase